MLYTRKREGAPIEILNFRSGELEAREIMTEIVRRGEGVAWDEIAILYCSNALSRLFKEALMWARIPYSPVGDVGVYQSAEIKFALALLRRRADPTTTQPTHSCCLPCTGLRAWSSGTSSCRTGRTEIFDPPIRLRGGTAARGCRDQSRHEACDDLAFRFANWTRAAVRLHEEHSGRTRIQGWVLQPQRFPRQTSGATSYRDRAARSA